MWREDSMIRSDVDPGPQVLQLNAALPGESDICVVKYDENGQCLWGFSIGGDQALHAAYMASDGIGNIYLTGNFLWQQ